MDKLFKFSLKMLLTYLLLASPSARRIVHVVKYAVEDATQCSLSPSLQLAVGRTAIGTKVKSSPCGRIPVNFEGI